MTPSRAAQRIEFGDDANGRNTGGYGFCNGFGTTPTDYLIVCGVLALMVFGTIAASSRNVVEAVLFAVVLMYACEILVGSTADSSGRRLLQYSTLGTLLIVLVRGVL